MKKNVESKRGAERAKQDELVMILADMDAEAALLFLKEVIWAQVQAVHRKE